MRKRKLTGIGLVLVGLVLTITLLSAAPAEAGWPFKKCFCGFWDFNADLFFGVPGLPYGGIFGDCFWISSASPGGKAKLCSGTWGTCGTFEQTSREGTQNTWEGRIRGIPFFAGGRIVVSAGLGERRGPGSVLTGVTQTRDLFFIPAISYNGTVEGAEAPASFCPVKNDP